MFRQQKFSGGPPGQNKQLSGFVAGAEKSASPKSVLCVRIQGFIFTPCFQKVAVSSKHFFSKKRKKMSSGDTA